MILLEGHDSPGVVAARACHVKEKFESFGDVQ